MRANNRRSHASTDIFGPGPGTRPCSRRRIDSESTQGPDGGLLVPAPLIAGQPPLYPP
jgi:hypothetical protein